MGTKIETIMHARTRTPWRSDAYCGEQWYESRRCRVDADGDVVIPCTETYCWHYPATSRRVDEVTCPRCLRLLMDDYLNYELEILGA